MRTPILVLILLALAATGARAQNATTALSALRMLPKGDAQRLARIEARDGNPTPERWHFLVNDPKDPQGLREFVVAGGEVVAARSISQFAETVKPEEVVGADAVKIDSDHVAKIAQDYAEANKVSAVTLRYALRKNAAVNAPVWIVTCLDGDGKRLGEVVVGASKGMVLSHGGFPLDPAPEKPRVAVAEEPPRERDRSTPRRIATRSTKPVPAQPAPPPENNPLRKIGEGLQKIFGGNGGR